MFGCDRARSKLYQRIRDKKIMIILFEYLSCGIENRATRDVPNFSIIVIFSSKPANTSPMKETCDPENLSRNMITHNNL